MQATLSRRRWLKLAASVAGMTILTGAMNACGGSAAGSTGGVTKLTLGCRGDELAYDTVTLTAAAGATVELTFENFSHHHQHNWVLVRGGADVAEAVYAAALAAGAAQDWLPHDHAQVIAHTPLVASGARATITFTAPPQVGDYIYLCTFPGHYLAGMQGILSLT